MPSPTPSSDPPPADLVGIMTAARLLRLPQRKVWGLIRAGRLRCWKVGRRWKLSRAEVLGLGR